MIVINEKSDVHEYPCEISISERRKVVLSDGTRHTGLVTKIRSGDSRSIDIVEVGDVRSNPINRFSKTLIAKEMSSPIILVKTTHFPGIDVYDITDGNGVHRRETSISLGVGRFVGQVKRRLGMKAILD